MKPSLETIGQLSELLPEEAFTKCVSELNFFFVTKHTSVFVQKNTLQNVGIFVLNLKKMSVLMQG